MRTDLLTTFLIVASATVSFAQTPNAADGPWSGQMQCVLSVKGPNYQDEQTHSWRITPGPPFLNGVFRQWPAVWSVQGSGSRTLTTGAAETWKTSVPETNAPLAFSVNAVTGQMRIGSQHGLLNINGGITGSASNAGTRTPIIGALQEWPFPITDDVATATTISGTRTRTAVNTSGWRQPPGVPTTETCTWRFDKTAATTAPVSQSSGATGTTTGSSTTLRSAGAGTIQSTTTETTSTRTLNRETAGLPAGTVAAFNALQITVTYPNGGETLTVGTPLTITWSHLLPNNTTFTADVSYDGGATWTPTNSSITGAGPTASVTWNVGGSPSTRGRVRVRTADGSLADQSNADFTIAAPSSGSGGTSTSSTGTSSCTGACTVRITSPNGGETWTTGVASTFGLQGYRVTWTSTYPSTQTFEVNFSADGGASWTLLTRTTGTALQIGSASGAGVPWTLPYTERALFSVTPYREPGGDTSDAPFQIRKPLLLTAPNGGETLTVGGYAAIAFTWAYPQQSGYSPALQVSYDGGTTWTDIRASDANFSVDTIAGRGRGGWRVLGPAASKVRFRINAVTDPTTSRNAVSSDDSDADLAIAESSTSSATGAVRITSPNGGETWTTGVASTFGLQGYRVTWTSTYPSTQTFEVNFSADGGASWTLLTRTTGTALQIGSASGAGVPWTLPYTERALFSVTPYREPGGDTSDAPFQIRKPLLLTAPNGGETLTVGGYAAIAFTWAYPQQSGYSPALQVSYDGGTTWTDIRASDANFSVDTIAGRGRGEWRVLGPAASKVRFRINAVTDPTTSRNAVSSDDSDADLAIAESPTSSGTGTVRITSPNGGETWTTGVATYGSQGYRVTWTSTYPSTQMFEVNFSADGGASWTQLTRTTGTSLQIGSATGAGVPWTLPYTERALFSVTPYREPGGDTSDAPFQIRKPLLLTAPNGGETLTVGAWARITFTWAYPQQSGYGPALQVSYDGGTTWTDVRASDVNFSVDTNAGRGTGEWRVLGPAATKVRFRINAVTDPRLGTGVVSTDESDADLTIVSASQ